MMKVYLLCEGERGTVAQQATVCFFKRTALKKAQRRIENGGKWEEIFDHESDAVKFWVTSALWMSIVPLMVLFTDFSLRRWIRQRCHWQNLNDKKDGTTGSVWKHGRAWIRGKYDESIKGRRKELHLEWSLWTHFWAMQLDVGSGDADDGISLWVACGLFSLHVTLEGILSRKFIERQRQKAIDTKWMGYAYMAFPRVTGIRIHSGSIWFEIWNQDAGWDSRQPKWMSFNFNVVDFLFGRTKYASKEIQSTEAEIVLNDGRHPLKVTLTEDSWKRPRLPKAKIVRRAKIESVKGVPVPGKGENSWDCDDDAIFGSTFPAESLEDALSKFRESVLKTRERYGGKNWLPEKDKEAV